MALAYQEAPSPPGLWPRRQFKLSTVDPLQYYLPMATTHAERSGPGSALLEAPTREAFEALGELLALMHAGLQRAMADFGLPGSYAHALAHIQESSVSMKELSQRVHCDPSFVTAIADVLEEKGLARREVDQADRRVKNLVLTARGEEARATLQREFYENLPGIRTLPDVERAEFVALLRKMVAAERAGSQPGPDGGQDGGLVNSGRTGSG